MSEKQKPDGWVAWHPEGGIEWCTAFPRKEVVERHICMLKGHSYADWETDLEEAKDRGWRIRPVKLVFLDEVNDEE